MTPLTPNEAAIFKSLEAGRFVPSRALVGAVWPDRRPRQPMAALRVHMVALRRKLEALDIEIEGRARVGYCLHLP